MSEHFGFRTPQMAWWELLDSIRLAEVHETLGFGAETIVFIPVLTDENWSYTDWISANISDIFVCIMEHKGKNTIKFVDEVFDISELLVKMEQNLAVGASSELQIMLFDEVFVIVNLCVGDDCNVSRPQRLISTSGIINSKPLKA